MRAIRGRIFVNRRSGSDESQLDELRDRFADHGVQECAPDEMEECVRAALRDGVDFIGIAGGDGSVNCGAQELRGTDTPLLVIPGGTRNHFAGDLGIDDVDAARVATQTGAQRRVDLGRVNGRCFVNNSSVGAYATLVRDREARERRLSKRLASIIATYRVLRHGRPLEVSVDGGEPQEVWLVFVGNGCYGTDLSSLASRDSLESNILDIRIIRADRPRTRLRLMLHAISGRLRHSQLIEQRSATGLRIDTPLESVDVAIDGEVETLTCPLEYVVEPATLTVLVPGDGANGGHR